MNYGHATENEKQEINQLMQEVEQHPNDSKKLTRLGSLLFVVCFFPSKTISYYLKHATALDPLNVDALFWLAMSLYHNEFENEQAKEYLEQALLVDPTRADCWSLLSAVASDLQEDSEVILSYVDKAIMHEPTWIIPREQRIRLLLKLERFSQMKQELYEIHKLIQHKKPAQSDSVEEYYESSVTGRSSSLSSDIKEYMEKYSTFTVPK